MALTDAPAYGTGASIDDAAGLRKRPAAVLPKYAPPIVEIDDKKLRKKVSSHCVVLGGGGGGVWVEDGEGMGGDGEKNCKRVLLTQSEDGWPGYRADHSTDSVHVIGVLHADVEDWSVGYRDMG